MCTCDHSSSVCLYMLVRFSSISVNSCKKAERNIAWPNVECHTRCLMLKIHIKAVSICLLTWNDGVFDWQRVLAAKLALVLYYIVRMSVIKTWVYDVIRFQTLFRNVCWACIEVHCVVSHSSNVMPVLPILPTMQWYKK